MKVSNSNMNELAGQMKAARLPKMVIDNFFFYYNKLREGETGLIAENQIQPVKALAAAETLPDRLSAVGEKAMRRTVAIKLNGGLGTSMGLKGPKSLLKIKAGYSFLDIIVRQALALDQPLPVIFMNSFNTRRETRKALKHYPDLQGRLPLDFLQHKIPKLNAVDLSAVRWSEDPMLEWCPPGHGDIYISLMTSGMLDSLLSAGFQYAFVSNADNLGATVDTAILGHFAHNNLPFMMEVCRRRPEDKKGGHLARLKNGGYVLREIAQCPESDQGAFEDIDRHIYFNTNNIWLNLKALKQVLIKKKGLLGLPMIRNQKTVNPRDDRSPAVIQLETAMGAAICVFPGAQAIQVPRSRFIPVKNSNDLLAIRSDCYLLNDRFQIVPNSRRKSGQPTIGLDNAYYKRIDDFENRFAFGVPLLKDCISLRITGDFKFGRRVNLVDAVTLHNRSQQTYFIDDETRIHGELRV